MSWSTLSRQARGYGAQWERVRLLVLQRDSYLCQCRHCRAEGRPTLATEVHHVVSKAEAARKDWTKARADDPSNLASMAHDCHVRADAEAQGKTLKPRQRFDARGYPIPEGVNPRGGRSSSVATNPKYRSALPRARPPLKISETE